MPIYSMHSIFEGGGGVLEKIWYAPCAPHPYINPYQIAIDNIFHFIFLLKYWGAFHTGAGQSS